MPNAQNNPGINAKRFAGLLAGFDLANASEEEAVSKGRALRKMAENANMRIVDLMELPEVKKAIDDQMHPARTESPALQEALELLDALQEELTERTRDVTTLAELLRESEEALGESRKVARFDPRYWSHPSNCKLPFVGLMLGCLPANLVAWMFDF